MRWNHISVPPLLACLPRNPFRAMLSMFCFPVPWNRYTMWWKGAERRCWRSSKRFFKLVRRRKKGKEGKEGKVGKVGKEGKVGKVGKVGRYDDAAEFEVKVQRAGRGVNGICEWDRTHIYTLKAGTTKTTQEGGLQRGIKQHAVLYGSSHLQLWVADVLGTVQRH